MTTAKADANVITGCFEGVRRQNLARAEIGDPQGVLELLERLFRQYVGVGPKWVVQRYRLFEAADRLASEPDLTAA